MTRRHTGFLGHLTGTLRPVALNLLDEEDLLAVCSDTRLEPGGDRDVLLGRKELMAGRLREEPRESDTTVTLGGSRTIRR